MGKAKLSTMTRLRRLRTRARKLIEELETTIQAVPSELSLFKRSGQMVDLVVSLRELRVQLKQGGSIVHQVLPAAEERLCRKLADQPSGELSLRYRGMTITPMAEGFFQVSDTEALFAHLWKTMPAQAAIRLYSSLVGSKRNCKEFADSLLKDGQPLPPGIGKYTIPTVRIRKH